MKQQSLLNKEIAEYRQNFYKVYQSKILPIFREYEQMRKKELKISAWKSLGLLALGLFVGFDFLNRAIKCEIQTFTMIEGFITIVAFVMILVVMVSSCEKFCSNLKKSCMQKLLSAFGNIRWYDEKKVINDADLEMSGLFAEFNERDVYDGFKGEYKGVPFEISETYMSQVSVSGRTREEVSVFRGVVLKFNFNKEIQAKTIITSKYDKKIMGKSPSLSWWLFGLLFIPIFFLIFITSATLDWVSFFVSILFTVLLLIVYAVIRHVCVSFVKPKAPFKYNEIKLEDPEFSNKYRAYSTNQVEGRYLITPAFMERFKNIQTAFGTKNVKSSFYDNNLMFAISTNKNLFEIGDLFQSLDNPMQLEQFFDEIISIYLMIDYFKLNDKIGL